MLARITNPYVILVMAVTSIMIAILGDKGFQLHVINLIFGLTMFLIILRGYHKGDRKSINHRVAIALALVPTYLVLIFLYYFNLFSELKVLFIMSTCIIKLSVYGYGWLSTIKILMRKQKVTENTIIMAITAYLFIGIIWSFIYYAAWQIDPHAFHLSIPSEYELKSWNLVMYFSLTTLTTLGYGDVIPIAKVVMAAANFEAIAGSIYLTVIIARLVSLYSLPD